MAKVGIVMGSDSDLKVMSKAADMLEELGIEYELTIISAHREPDELIEWTRGAEERDVKVIIAGAGMAAALPGMCAALFALPVIGVPLSGKNLDGMDAVFSIMQMPPGVPVATVAIDGAKNAAILAAKILAASDEELLKIHIQCDQDPRRYTVNIPDHCQQQMLRSDIFCMQSATLLFAALQKELESRTLLRSCTDLHLFIRCYQFIDQA